MNISLPDLRSYIYLDEGGIESLYAQSVDFLEVEKTTTLEQTVAAKAGTALRFKNFVLKLLGGPELEASIELAGERKRSTQSKQVRTIEQKLQDLISSLKKFNDSVLFTTLVGAEKATRSNGKSVFILVEDRFDAPQFWASDGVDQVNSSAYLNLQKGTSGDYNDRDDYYRTQLQSPLTLVAAVEKLRRSSQGMRYTGHDAIFFRGYIGKGVPLGVFGRFISTPSYCQIKPYAIWER